MPARLPARRNTAAEANRVTLSGFRFGRYFLRVFHDSARNFWGYERYEGDQRVSTRTFPSSRKQADLHFAEEVQQIVQMHIAHANMKPLVSRYDLPDGVKGVRTFDPAKRNTNRTIFDYYHRNSLPGGEEEK